MSNAAPVDDLPAPPEGWRRVAWLGPGFLWMVSAAGAGELLLTPRVGALYGYTFLWALLAAVALKWFINREIGRFAVCTGASVLDGFARLPGPRHWAVWAIVVPQALVAVATIAGLAGSAATALVLALPGDVRWWTVASVAASTALVLGGRYRVIERVAMVLAVALGAAAIVAASSVASNPAPLAAGLIPHLPVGVDFGEVLPWLGFTLSGAAGMIWYSYWLPARGYGAAVGGPVDPCTLNARARGRLRGWLTQMTWDNTVAVIGGLLVTLAFLILGAELLAPRGLVPEENLVAGVLGELLGGVWGPIGFWFMVVGVFVGFWDTVLSDQDGFGRMFANGTAMLLRPFEAQKRWMDEGFLRRLYLLVLLTLAPLVLYLFIGHPVALLKVAGAIEAAHIPIVTALILWLNQRRLPPDLRPSRLAFVATALAGVFFAAFAVVYVATLGAST